ncbi:MAG: helix-turn-helix transcriptional regulator [Burkholderiales bacterium]
MKQHIYPILASERRRLGMSQQALAARAGLRREKVNRLESKGEDVGLEDLARLLDALGMELAVFRKGQAPPMALSSSLSEAERDLVPQDFEKAAFVDGSKVRILSWGKLPK